MAPKPDRSPAPRAFRDGAAFRAWLEKHHASADELLVRLFRTHARDRGMTYADALDEALCFGWIDGVRRALDADSFTIRFTPRRPKSIWSAVNIRHVARLEKAGRMRETGRAAFARRDEARSRVYAFENRPKALAPVYARRMRANERAWAWFSAQPPWYRRTITFWVMSAKREETRQRRLETLIACSERGKRVGLLERPATPGKPAATARARKPARRTRAR